MSEFEYLTVVVSIILGLGMTHLLSGIGRFVAHFIVLGLLGLLGLVWHSRRFHLALASWVLVIALSWSFIVRRFLT